MSRDRINGIIGIILGCLVLIGSMLLPPSNVPDDIGPAVFPIIAAVLIIVPAIYMVLKKPAGEEQKFMTKIEWKRFWILIAVFFIYAALLYIAGFLIATPIVTFIISRMFSQGSKVPLWQIIVYAVVLSLVVYICFYKGLGLILPQGQIFNIAF